MKKFPNLTLSLTVAASLSVASLLFAQSAFALEIVVTPNGSISFFDDGVLGETTESAPTQRTATKVVPSRAGNRIRLQATDKAIEVGVENRTSETTKTIEQNEVKRLRAKFPAQVTDVHLQNLEGEENQERTEYQLRLLEERKDRTDNVEVRSNLNEEGSQELEVRSKSATARLRKAEFEVEPETNTVTITTPNGEEHVLNHLPDQALEKIRQRVTLQNTDAGTPDFDIETNESGDVIYRTRGTKQKKFLGLFNRGVEAVVTLNDTTGDVTEVEKASPGVFGQFLDAFTF